MAMLAPLDPAPKETRSLDGYFQTLQMIERLHKLMLDLIKDEFERIGQIDLTPVQAMILYNMSTKDISAGELRSRGLYQGSNVSYNLRKLVEMGYIHQERCDMDRRSVRIRLTDRGLEVKARINAMFLRHARELDLSGVLDDPPIERVNLQWRRIERYWLEQIRYIY